MNDFNLSEHFKFSELTVTNNAALQATNRKEAQALVESGKALAALLEELRAGLGGAPLVVHSAYRCPELNAATKGSAPKSQHMLFEACDFGVPSKYEASDAGNSALFAAVRDILKAKGLAFSQLIDEGWTARNPASVWVHVSLGAPRRDRARCGQLLKMRDGAFSSLGTVPQQA